MSREEQKSIAPPKISELLSLLGKPELHPVNQIPKCTDCSLKFEKENVFEWGSVLLCKEKNIKLEIKDNALLMFGRKCQRLFTDNYLFNAVETCVEGYRIYLTTYAQIGVNRKFFITQAIYEPADKPKGEIVCLYFKYLKPGTKEWVELKYFFRFVD